MVRQGHYDKLFIAGEWLPPSTGDRIAVVSPVSEQVIATVASAGTADIDLAVAAARDAFDRGPWPRLAMVERIAVVELLKDAFVGHHDDLAQVITDEMGSPITFSRNLQATVPVRMLEASST